jgi:hypothetical protein
MAVGVNVTSVPLEYTRAEPSEHVQKRTFSKRQKILITIMTTKVSSLMWEGLRQICTVMSVGKSLKKGPVTTSDV